jgi:hypothetical protein
VKMLRDLAANLNTVAAKTAAHVAIIHGLFEAVAAHDIDLGVVFAATHTAALGLLDRAIFDSNNPVMDAAKRSAAKSEVATIIGGVRATIAGPNAISEVVH